MGQGMDGESKNRGGEILRIAAILAGIALAKASFTAGGAGIQAALDSAGLILPGSGPVAYNDLAFLPAGLALLALLLRRDVAEAQGLRLVALGLGAGACILLADPLTRISLHLIAPMAEAAGPIRISIQLAVAIAVAAIYGQTLFRALRRPPEPPSA